MVIIEKVERYFSTFSNQEPFAHLTRDSANTDFDYNFSVLHRYYTIISEGKGYGVFNDIDSSVWLSVKAAVNTLGVNYFTNLDEANENRQVEWDTSNQITGLFRAVELGGEVGEILNVVKKLEREKMGIAGSRDTLEHLAEEIADGFISLTLLAQEYDIDVDTAIANKFNNTSKNNGLRTRLLVPLV